MLLLMHVMTHLSSRLVSVIVLWLPSTLFFLSFLIDCGYEPTDAHHDSHSVLCRSVWLPRRIRVLIKASLMLFLAFFHMSMMGEREKEGEQLKFLAEVFSLRQPTSCLILTSCIFNMSTSRYGSSLYLCNL